MEDQTKRNRLREIISESDKLQRQLDALNKEARDVRLAMAKDEYSCSCVKLNRDIEIYDGAEQIRRGRKGLGCGLVADCLSARCDCKDCLGTGMPKPAAGWCPKCREEGSPQNGNILRVRGECEKHPMHNHFGDLFSPSDCPACKAMKDAQG